MRTFALALAATVALSAWASAQDADPNELVFLGNEHPGSPTHSDSRGFVVPDSAPSTLEVRWWLNGTGHLRLDVLDALGASSFNRTFDATDVIEGSAPWEAASGEYQVRWSFTAFTGDAEASVWRTDFVSNPTPAPSTPPPTETPLSQVTPVTSGGPSQGSTQGASTAPASSAFSWVTPALIVQSVGVAATIALGSYGIVTVRRRQRRLADHLDRIERAFEAHKAEHETCRAELLSLRSEFKEQLKDQAIEERQYLLLEGRINEYLNRLGPPAS